MVCTYVIYVSTVMPAAEATFMIRPPWPPFVWPILSIAVNTPRTAPINITSKFASHPCYIIKQNYFFRNIFKNQLRN